MYRKTHLLSVALSVGLLTACGSAAEQARTDGEPQSSVVQGADKEAPASATEGDTNETEEDQTEAAAPEASEEPDVEAVAELAVDDYGFTQLTGGEYGSPGVTYAIVIENSGTGIATQAQYQVAFENEDGEVLDSDEGYITAVMPGASMAAAGYAHDVEGVSKMTVQLMPGDMEELDGESGDFIVTKIRTKAEEYGGLKTTASVESPFAKDLKDLEVIAVYRDSSGDVVGGDFTYLNFVPAGGSSAVTVNTMNWEGDVPAETEVFVGLSIMSILGD